MITIGLVRVLSAMYYILPQPRAGGSGGRPPRSAPQESGGDQATFSSAFMIVSATTCG
jgi:hypothetical protein